MIRTPYATINRSPGPWPGLLGLAVLCASLARAAAAPGLDLRLADELCEEGSWQACLVECRRVLASEPDNKVARDLMARAEKDACPDCACPRPEVAGHLVDEPPSRPRSMITAPFRWAISFYQSQIAPALGRRCSLHPSCSRYAAQALRRHGLLGIAMYADRAVREPGVVAEARRPLFVNGRRLYADPLDDHDWWMKEK